ncbi:MAG: FAD-binding oxidoreductase [Proteobacteria bacterium]|nr:MAG: FAD-binding oxidoreductase [Pseudomonadota bacterium]
MSLFNLQMNSFILPVLVLFSSVPCLSSSALALSTSQAGGSPSRTLSVFKTDGCTGYPEGTYIEPNLWRHCCIEHDLYYWTGGPLSAQDQADLKLKACVEATGEDVHAQIMYYAVILGHQSPYIIHDKRWGNGWKPEGSETQALSQSEFEVVESTLRSSAASEKVKNIFLDVLKTQIQ